MIPTYTLIFCGGIIIYPYLYSLIFALMAVSGSHLLSWFLRERFFQQIVGIQMETNCDPLLTDIFLYSYVQSRIYTAFALKRKEAVGISVQFHIKAHRWCFVKNDPEFENYLGQMYPIELKVRDTTEINTSVSYLDLLLSIGRDGQLHNSTSIYHKRDDFNFHILNFLFLGSNIPASPNSGVL